MKNIISKLLLIIFIVCTTISAFADPGITDTNGSLENTDAPAPINNYIWVLALIGLFIAFKKLMDIQKVKSKQKT
jgi:hypothetical protein